ncbi:MAG: DUF2065 domain-containing protein [Nevskia sp.]|nr:DUF2065 domain-containing protein [Nevskia sp.]MCK9385906.1 DUF2065 domain-containing protein [Nevskia sp.]
MLDDLLRAGALMLILEGILPFLAPARTRRIYTALAGMNERTLRRFGLFGMVAGLGVLQYLRWIA